MPASAFNPGTAAQDKDFLAASYPDKIRYLASQDQDFARANPQDQIGYINHLLGKPAPNFTTEADRSGGPPKPGFMGATVGEAGRVVKGIAGQVFNAIPGTELIPNSARSKVGLPPAPDVIGQGQQIANEWQAEKQAGLGLPYRIGSTAAGIVGADVPAMEKSATQGDIGGVLGHAAVPMALAAAPLGVEGIARVANRVIPSTTRAGTGLNLLTDSPDAAFANHPVETPNTLAIGRKISNELEITGEKPHAIIQHYLGNADFATEPMNMYEARTMLKRVNNVIDASKGFAADTATKTTITNLKRFAGALDEDISQAANQHGFGADYANMRNEYRHGSQIIRTGEGIGAPVGALVGYGVGRELGEPLGGTMVGGMMGKAVGRKTTGAVARGIVERNAGPPRLRSLPPTPEAHLRTILDAKEGRILPGEADRRISRAGGNVRVRPIPQPTE